MAARQLARFVRDVRSFNRFYTRQIGVLNEATYDRFTLAEARLMFELLMHGDMRAADLSRELSMDPAQVSRLVQRLRHKSLVVTERHAEDGRARSITLTKAGREAGEAIDSAAGVQIAEMLSPIPEEGRLALVDAMNAITSRLDPRVAPFRLRSHRVGELGILINRQALLYNLEYGWNGEFEALIAGLYRDFEMAPADPPKALWVADSGGVIAGSVFVVPAEGRPDVAQLRMLYAEPFARGRGLGQKLVRQAITFSRQSGYRQVTLWTQDVLASARRIYETEGFTLASEEKHHSFGKELVGQYWNLDL